MSSLLLTLSDKESLKSLIENNDVFLFDCDGVVWRGNNIINGIVECYNWLKSLNKKVYFITNNSLKSRIGYVKRFHELNININENEIYCTAYAAAKYLYNNNFHLLTNKKVYVISSGDGITDELSLLNIKYIKSKEIKEIEKDNNNTYIEMDYDKNVNAVIVGIDLTFNYSKLQYAQLCINNNKDCLFIATNTDSNVNLTENHLWCGAGTMVNSVLSSIKPNIKTKPDIICGKPNNFMLNDILTTLPNISRNKICMIGDRLDTDIEFGKINGLNTLLVLSGVTDLNLVLSINNNLQRPDFIVESVKELYEKCQ